LPESKDKIFWEGKMEERGVKKKGKQQKNNQLEFMFFPLHFFGPKRINASPFTFLAPRGLMHPPSLFWPI